MFFSLLFSLLAPFCEVEVAWWKTLQTFFNLKNKMSINVLIVNIFFFFF